MEQELQIVMQQVEARTTRRTGIVADVAKAEEYHVTVEDSAGTTGAHLSRVRLSF
jgi:hypothetical protein